MLHFIVRELGYVDCHSKLLDHVSIFYLCFHLIALLDLLADSIKKINKIILYKISIVVGMLKSF
jgi:hypothetical protein